MAKELPKRSEVKVEDTWNLKDMYESDAAWEAELLEIKKLAEEAVKMEGHVAESAQNLLKTLELDATIDEKLSLAYNYAERQYDEDTSNTAHQAMAAKIMSMAADISSQLAFIVPEILAVDEAVLEGFYKEQPKLELYRKEVAEIQRVKEHKLSTEMEKLVAMTAEMSRVSYDTFNIMDNADMLFPEVEDEDGETVRITHGRFIALLESANREVRENTFKKYYICLNGKIHNIRNY